MKPKPKPSLHDELTKAPHNILPIGEGSAKLSERKEEIVQVPELTEEDAEGTEYAPVRDSFVVEEEEQIEEEEEEDRPPEPIARW